MFRLRRNVRDEPVEVDCIGELRCLQSGHLKHASSGWTKLVDDVRRV